ncbi:MAG: apolipoprotein N-acyltransferase [Desulfobacteraceae bacterium]|nr:apolipoprotein N-acyltransferase [Desulfobacteraceae bacterium]
MPCMLTVLSILSAAGLAAAFGCWPLGFVALVPFFQALIRAASIWQRLWLGIVFGAFHGGFMGHWLIPTLTGHFDKSTGFAILFVILAVCVPAALLYGILALSISLFRFQGFRFFLLTLPALWTLADLAKEWLPFFIPWGLAGYAALPFQTFAQAADLGGVYGLTFLMVAVNALVAFLFTGGRGTGRKRGRQAAAVLSIVFLILVPCIYGMARIAAFEPLAGPGESGFSAVAVQGNFTPKDRWSGNGFHRRLNRYLDLSGKGELKEARLIVWPETVLNAPRKVDSRLLEGIRARLYARDLLVSGGLRQADSGHGVHNSAYLIPGMGKVGWYDKRRLLPYGESPVLKPVLGRFARAPARFEPGTRPAVVSTRLGPMGLSICFEALYPEAVRQSVAGGAGLLINLSNDAWFGKGVMPRLHLAVSAMRAIENRRFLVRASTGGISAVISPTGELLAATELGKPSAVTHRVAIRKKTSLYTRLGNWVILGSVLLLMAQLAGSAFAPVSRRP